MIVRLADFDRDALAIIDGARDFVSRMDWTSWLPEDDEAFVAGVGRMVCQEGMEIAVAEAERIVGGIGVLYLPFDLNPRFTVAVEKFIWCAEDAPKTTLLRLLRFVSRRIDMRKPVIREFASLTSSPPGIESLYHRMGLRPVQTTWMG